MDRTALTVLHDRRVAAGLSQRDMAQRLGMTQPGFCHWERGRRTPSAERLKAWREALTTQEAA